MTENIYKDLPPYKLGIIQSRASRNIIELREKILNKHELSSPEWFVLGHVASQTNLGGVKVGSIAALLDVNSTYVTGILRRLEAKGLTVVQPGKEDRRVRWVQVTKKGITTTEQIDAEFIEQSSAWLGTASPKVMQQYIALLQMLAQDPAQEEEV